MALASGCASVIEGTSQQISVTTNPAGARCTFWKDGTLIADVNSTPGAVTIQKSRADLVIVCDKPGYAAVNYVNRAGLSAATFANILTAGLAWAVDYTRGADSKYESEVSLSLAPLGTGMPIQGQGRMSLPDEPPPPPPPPPGPSAGRPRPPMPPPPSPTAPVAAPAPTQVECASADGSRIRMTGTSCPAGWAPAR